MIVTTTLAWSTRPEPSGPTQVASSRLAPSRGDDSGRLARSYRPPKIGVPFQLSTPTGLRATPTPLRTSVSVSPWSPLLSDVDGEPINWTVTCILPFAT